MFCQAKPHVLFNAERMGEISTLKSRMKPTFTQQTWVVLTVPINFVRFIFWFLFNLSVCNGFILESTSRVDQGKQKRLMINFRLDLAKQLIDGFSWRKIKQRSQETPHHPVARRKTCLSSCGWTEEKMCSVYQSRAKNTQRIQDRDML